MTTEEKARAYDEALKWMRELYPGLHGATKEDAEHYFPELRESEDERIRKELIFFLKEEIPQCSIKEHAEKLKEFVAYLEKQKYDRMKPIYDARESFESALEKAWNDYHNGYENVDKLEDDYVECAHAKGFREGYLFGIEKQKEQEKEEPKIAFGNWGDKEKQEAIITLIKYARWIKKITNEECKDLVQWFENNLVFNVFLTQYLLSQPLLCAFTDCSF